MNYKEQTQNEYRQKLNYLLDNLPDFCKTYFYGREHRLSPLSSVSYAYNLSVFFNYLCDNNQYFKQKGVKRIDINDLSLLTSEDIEEFLHWLRFHDNNGNVVNNKPSTIEHYLSSINGLYTYFIKRKHLTFNPVDAIDREKKKKKQIIRLEGDEKIRLLSSVSHGVGLNQRQLQFHDKNKERDLAIVQLFLNTGIRISELIGINVSDLNFETHSISIIRKGGNYQSVYFSDNTQLILKEYLDVRHKYYPTDDEEALFLNRDGNRISARSVQILVKKYKKAALPDKKQEITPHKLRSTFATESLRATHDIELVSEQLGHASLSVTQVYADYNDQARIDARNNIP